MSGSFLLRMRNVSDQSCRDNQNTHFVFSNLFSKMVPFMRKCEKILYSGAGHMAIWQVTWQYGRPHGNMAGHMAIWQVT
jgi:hypothetical protein